MLSTGVVLETRREGCVALVLHHADTGDREALLVNTIGSYDGSALAALTPGDYMLDVTADGVWEVTVEQPRPQEAEPLTRLEGNGQTAAGPTRLDSGMARIQMTHNGSSNFAVILYDAQGDRIGLLANDIGSFDGSKAQQISASGIYWFDVTADGDWSISLT